MAKEVTRVNGKGGEVMEVAGGVVSFRTGGTTHRMDADKVAVMEVMNAEDARSFVEESPQDTFGLWAYNKMPSSRGKSVYVVARDTVQRWVMEISKTGAKRGAPLPLGRPEEQGGGRGGDQALRGHPDTPGRLSQKSRFLLSMHKIRCSNELFHHNILWSIFASKHFLDNLLGAVFTIGSIACVLGAYAAVSVWEQPNAALVLAVAAIFMFVKIKYGSLSVSAVVVCRESEMRL